MTLQDKLDEILSLYMRSGYDHKERHNKSMAMQAILSLIESDVIGADQPITMNPGVDQISNILRATQRKALRGVSNE